MLLDPKWLDALALQLVGMPDCEDILRKEKKLCMDLCERDVPNAIYEHIQCMAQLVQAQKNYIYKRNMTVVQRAHEELDVHMGSWIRDMVEIWKD